MTDAPSERYPAIEPYESGMLDVTDGHSLYWECVGNPDGTPAVYLHGGPGGGTSPGARRYFDPQAYSAVLFDQRGCGRSIPGADAPAADLSTNTTSRRGHVGDQEGDRLDHPRHGPHLPAGLGTVRTHVSLMPGSAPHLQLENPRFQLTFARLVTHYWSQGCFLADDEIARNMPRLLGIPAVLIHGRYDVSGPLDTAWHLHQAWPDSRLVVLDDAGHGGGGFVGEIVTALDSFRRVDHG